MYGKYQNFVSRQSFEPPKPEPDALKEKNSCCGTVIQVYLYIYIYMEICKNVYYMLGMFNIRGLGVSILGKGSGVCPKPLTLQEALKRHG